MTSAAKPDSINPSRRRLFNRRKDTALRPPWSRKDIEFTDVCTRCDACILACETQILVRGDGGFPEIDFSRGECTFCQQCVSSCQEDLFNVNQQQPWLIVATVSDNCLAHKGIFCQSCKDVCDPIAISFTPQIGKAPLPHIALDTCTGCGACVVPCPANAITLA